MAKATILINELEKFCPEIILHCKSPLKKQIDLDFERLEKTSFMKCPSISIDKAIMEKQIMELFFRLT